MIQDMRKVPVSEGDYPFQAAYDKCRFDEIGYVEEEYFMTGTANIYTEVSPDHDVEPLFEGAPYTTRLLIRRPAQVRNFSGNVVVEILNASAFMDIDRMWVNTWPFLTRNGDLYIGITSKGHVIDTLKRFNPERYAAIDWKNPLPQRKAPDRVPFGLLPQYESGLFWDMVTELAKLLRQDEERNPIRIFYPRYLYLTGWSQSGSYMSRILRSFDKNPKAPLFDGYLEGGGGCSTGTHKRL